MVRNRTGHRGAGEWLYARWIVCNVEMGICRFNDEKGLGDMEVHRCSYVSVVCMWSTGVDVALFEIGQDIQLPASSSEQRRVRTKYRSRSFSSIKKYK